MKTKMFIIIFSQCLTLAYAELPKASDYFPLQIGNKWQYRKQSSSDYMVEIVSDSLIGDTLLVYISKWTYLPRPDPTTVGYSYYYYNEDSTIVYKKWAREPTRFPGRPMLDTGHGIGHRWRFRWGDARYTFAVTDTGSAEIFDRTMSWLDVHSVDPRYDSLVVTTEHTRFVKGLGPVKKGRRDTLVYAQINGVEYGTKVNVDHNPQAMEQNPDGFELQVYPNPFNESTTIHFNRISSQHIQIQIYDMLGRSVRTIPVSSGLVGPVSVRWDGKDDQGNVLASGLYWVMLKQKNQFESQKILYLK